jgi:hypothetical protein
LVDITNLHEQHFKAVDVNEVAANSDMLSFIHKPSDLFLVKTSYVYKPDEKTFVLILQVPLVTPHNLMPLFEFIPLSVYFNFSSNVTVTPEVGPNNMIAVGHLELGDTYFCKGRNVLLKDLTKTCLGAFYLADHMNIQIKCKFTIDGAQEKIFRLDSHTYVVYSLGKISTNQVCPKAKSISAVQISLEKTIRVNPSGYIRTMDHIIMADDREEVKILDKWLDWTWILPQLFQQPESEVVISAIERLRTKITGRFDADVLIQELETMSKEARTVAQEGILSHWIFTSNGAMIGGTILCLALLFCCWKAYTRNQAPLPYPPALSAPTVFNMTVDPIRR